MTTRAAELRARRVLTVFVAASVFLTGLVWYVLRPQPPDGSLAQPVESMPTVSTPATPAPEPAPSSWQLPDWQWDPLPKPQGLDATWQGLVDNQLNEVDVVELTGCPAPGEVTTFEQYETVVREQWDCLHASFTPIFQQLGLSTAPPELSFFHGIGADSACGWIEAPAFYCSADNGTAYFGTEHYQMAQQWELAVNEMVNHEYVHHIQSVTGITAAKVTLGPAPDVDRRAELQAICISGSLTYHNRSVHFGQAEFDAWHDRVMAMVASEVHGIRESLDHWGMRGLWAESMADCNTWAAETESVA